MLRRAHRCLALLAVVLFAACTAVPNDPAATAKPLVSPGLPGTADPTPSPAPSATDSPAPRPPIELPTPPAPAEVAGSTPDERASSLAALVTTEYPERLAGWLAAYDALGVPVITDDGQAVGSTGDDPIGAPYWRVWYAAAMSESGGGIPLSDFVRLFASGGENDFDAARAADALLADLRAAATSADPDQRLFGSFFAQLVRGGAGPTALADESVTADDLYLAPAAGELLSWLVIRGVAVAAAQAEADAALPGSQVIASLHAAPMGAPAARPVELPTREKCAEAAGDAEVTAWLNFLLNKIGGGFELKGLVRTPGFLDIVGGYLGWTDRKSGLVSNGVAWANVAGAALTLLMQYMALELHGGVEPDPMIRTQTTRDGDPADLELLVYSDPGKLPDGDKVYNCLASFVLNTFGVELKAPVEQRMAGVEVTLKPGVGFKRDGCPLCPPGKDDYVQFELRDGFTVGGHGNFTATTNENGEAIVPLLGIRQRRDLREPLPWIREASVHVSAQPEAVSGQTLFNIFLSGFTVGLSPSAGGIAGAAIEIAKTVHWSLGEKLFLVKDWAEYRLRVELIGTLAADRIHPDFDGLFTRNGLAEIPLRADRNGNITGSGPLLVTIAASYRLGGDLICEAEGEDTFTLGVEGKAADELVSLKTDWSGVGLSSGTATCRAGRDSFTQPFTPIPVPSGAEMGVLTSGFELPLADGESLSVDIPNPLWETTIVVTLVREDAE